MRKARKPGRPTGINCEVKKIIGVKQEDGSYIMERIHSKGDKPLWTVFCEYFRSLKIGETFSRVELFESAYNSEVVPALRGGIQTIDEYRRCLTSLKFITIVDRGVYKKEMQLPKGIKITKIKKAMKDVNTWREWFVPLHVKLEVDESELQ